MVVMFFVVMLVLGLVTSHVRADLESRAFDEELVAGARDIAERVNAMRLVADRPDLAPGFLRERQALVPTLFRIVRLDGAVALESITDWQVDWPSNFAGADFGERPQFATVVGTPGPQSILAPRPLRVVGVPVRDAAGTPHVVQVARDPVWLANADAFASNFYWFALPLALFAAAVSAWVLSTRATRQMRELAVAASEVSPQNLKLPEIPSRDREIADLQAQLAAAFARIEAGFVAQSRFLGDVAHELKTPLAVAAAQAQWIASAPDDRAEVVRLACSIDEDVRQLASLVDGFLLLAHAFERPGDIRPEQVELHDVVTEAIKRTRALARQQDVRIVSRFEVGTADATDVAGEGESALIGNHELLVAMLDNVLRNAVRYSDNGGRIDATARTDAEGWKLWIRDYGPGVPDDQTSAIFERFFRVRGRSERSAGNGIGLTIAHRVALFHGGGISAHNAEGGGLEVTITLPRHGGGHIGSENGNAAENGSENLPANPSD